MPDETIKRGKIRFGLIGTGWRAMFYVRAAQNLPERFEITGAVCHTEERAREFERQYAIPAFTREEELWKTKPEFVVTCVKKPLMAQAVQRCLTAGMPVLSETPLGTDISSLTDVYETMKKSGTLLQLAEQYALYPSHAARRALVASGTIGRVSSCMLSAMHDYHAVSMMRAYMGEENGPVTIRARQMKAPIVVTGARSGFLTDGETGEELRTLAQFAYADGRTGLYDFASVQYHSAIRSNHVRILGERGEIYDDEVLWLDGDGRPMQGRLNRQCDRMTGTIRRICLDDRCLYVNPFRTDVCMSEDEIAVADVIARMGGAVRTGETFYPVCHALRDGYLSCLMRAAAEENGQIRSVEMIWDRP